MNDAQITDVKDVAGKEIVEADQPGIFRAPAIGVACCSVTLR